MFKFVFIIIYISDFCLDKGFYEKHEIKICVKK